MKTFINKNGHRVMMIYPESSKLEPAFSYKPEKRHCATQTLILPFIATGGPR